MGKAALKCLDDELKQTKQNEEISVSYDEINNLNKLGIEILKDLTHNVYASDKDENDKNEIETTNINQEKYYYKRHNVL